MIHVVDEGQTMKTSNSIRCAVVVAVLGLSMALSAPQVFAAEFDYQVYPGDTCVKLAGAANIVRNELGGIANLSPAAILIVSCPVVNNVGFPGPPFVIASAFIFTTDRNPGPIISDNILCNLFQVTRIFLNSGIVFRIGGAHTQGASNNLQAISMVGPDPGNNTTGNFSTNFLKCLIPRQTSDGAFSELHTYGVAERLAMTSGGMLQAMLPPGAQERAAVEAQEMRVTQALTTEKEDSEWSQRAVTSWTQVFQQEGIKEELTGIQLDTIECRTTLCRLQLTLTAPPQGDAVFGEAFTKLILLAPWPVQGFGKIENPDGQAPVAVLYVAREGHSLP